MLQLAKVAPEEEDLRNISFSPAWSDLLRLAKRTLPRRSADVALPRHEGADLNAKGGSPSTT